MLKLLKSLFLSLVLFLLVYLALSAQPILTVTANDLGYGGYLFIGVPGLESCMVSDLAGNVLYQYPVRCHDFKRLADGDWIYFDETETAWKQYAPYSDTLKRTYAISGAVTNVHDIIAKDDYVWLLGWQEYAALSGTLVILIQDSVIQKQDNNSNILFNWRSRDYIGLDEAPTEFVLNGTYPHLAGSYPHINSLYEDVDGNLIVSFRQLNSVVKICVTGTDCQVGEFVWRLGGPKSDFTFANDRGFSKQHSALMTGICHDGANRCLLLFDNGNDFEPQYSRAVEYKLGNGIVTRTWEYMAGGGIFAEYSGNVQRLPNGDTVIGWGTAHQNDESDPTVTVVDWQGNMKYEAFLPKGKSTYRAHLYPVWQQYLPVTRK